MARITVEDCLQKVSNRFELTLLAAKRARKLFAGAKPLISTGNREVVTALREIADAKALVKKEINHLDRSGGAINFLIGNSIKMEGGNGYVR